ncbi:MAG: peptidoglycan DD-metalloendopeptidase family protein [Fimbriimonadaceae bacterium]|nr:peptidoglycan DD-metalloendopeptidase family protein [Chitinophagales bacterium]
MMKKIQIIILLACVTIVTHAQTCIVVDSECDGSDNYCYECSNDWCGPFELSNGIYRIPYIDGTDVQINNDHLNHCPRGRIDMVGEGGTSSPYKIAAAADGWIRAIEDDNNIQCDCSETSCANNYVWIEHPNGEWTKYTHMIENSVTDLGFEEGDWVTAGTYIGKEGEVGCASGVHLHFEVAQPIDTNTLIFTSFGGWIDLDWAKNVIPVICDITGNVFAEDAEYVAADCGGSCTSSLTNLTATYSAGEYDADIAGSTITTIGAVIYDDYASGLYQAGSSVTLLEGFEARMHSEFTARIGSCNEFPERLLNDATDLSTQTIVNIFPNPASANVTVQWTDDQERIYSIYITDITGRKIKDITRQQVSAGNNEIYFNAGDLHAGIYFLRMDAAEKYLIEKLVIQH